MNYIKIQNEKLDVGTINALVADESCGAISMFVGTTRDNFDDKKVICLEYEAYEPMAIKVMNKICDELRSKWPDLKHIAIYHRLGVVPVKEASVVIAISSPHRLSSLQSVQYAIDELKRSVPIWKKEKYENSTTNIENPLRRRLKVAKLNFDECTIDTSQFTTFPKGFIQINADEEELSRRIQCFVDKKREEIDLNNVLDFINKPTMLNASERFGETEEGTCARVNSVVNRQNNSKGHLKVCRVKNEYGPQMVSDYTNALDKLMGMDGSRNQRRKNSNVDIKPLPIGVSERIEKVEKYLNLPLPVSKDIYQRLKLIEEKIQFLETISPEYRHFVDSKKSIKNDSIQKKRYTIQDLDNYIAIFRNKK